MAEVTREMIQDYMIRKGGVVKNVDLVRHFRKFLQLDDPVQKGKSTLAHPWALEEEKQYLFV